MAAPADAAVKVSERTLAGCLDTCLDYSLTGYAMQRASAARRQVLSLEATVTDVNR